MRTSGRSCCASVRRRGGERSGKEGERKAGRGKEGLERKETSDRRPERDRDKEEERGTPLAGIHEDFPAQNLGH